MKNRKPIRKSWIFVVIASLLMAILTLVMCYMGGVFDFSTGKMAMPNLVGLTNDVALENLGDLSENVNIVYAESDEAIGVVVGQKPAQSTNISSKTQITLTVSSGSQAVAPEANTDMILPEVLSMTYNEAKSTLEGMGLVPVLILEEYSSTVSYGCVSRQSPLSGAKMTVGDTVSLTLSLGKPPADYHYTLTAGTGGTISPAGTKSVVPNGNLHITVTAKEGYEIEGLLINGRDVGAVSSYIVENVDKDGTAHAIFNKIAEPEPSTTPSSSSDIILRW